MQNNKKTKRLTNVGQKYDLNYSIIGQHFQNFLSHKPYL